MYGWMNECTDGCMYDVDIDEQHIVYSPCITTIDGSKSCIVKIPKKKKTTTCWSNKSRWIVGL